MNAYDRHSFHICGTALDASPIAVEQHTLSAEGPPLGAARFDRVVSTWTLCSIPDANRALGEERRVLKQGGRFFVLLPNEWKHAGYTFRGIAVPIVSGVTP